MLLKEKSILDIIYKKTKNIEESIDKSKRKEHGQVFTPLSVAQFMVDLFQLSKNEYEILDPGAGTGILSFALCEKIIKTAKQPKKISLVTYENDEKLVSTLKENLTYLKNIASAHGHTLKYNVQNNDFI